MGFPAPFTEDESVEGAAPFVEFTLDGSSGVGSDYGRLLGRPESHHNLLQLWTVTCWLPSTAANPGNKYYTRLKLKLYIAEFPSHLNV